MKQTQVVWDTSAVAAGLDEIGRSRGSLLAHLKDILDEFHGVTRPIEYYDLVTGDWLLLFSHNVYSAWHEVLAGNMPAVASPIPIITSMRHAQVLTISIDWHQHLRWAVTQLLQGQSSINWATSRESTHIKDGNKSHVLKRILRGISTRKPKILLTNPYFKCSPSECINALWRWRNWLAWDDMQYPVTVSSSANWRWRKNQSIEVSLHFNNFVELVRTLMPLYIPITLLEGLKDYRTAALAISLPRPRAVYSANALHGNLTWKLLAAEWRQEGTQLLYHQHGGGYGLEPMLAVEEYEIRNSDRFYSWGWQRESSAVYPLSPAMPSVRHNPRSKQILLNCLDLPTVPYRLMFTPMPGTIETMHRHTCEFLRELPDRRNLIIRPYPIDYGWGAVNMMRSVAPETRFDSHSSKSFSLFSASRLVVHNYLGTAWLETLGLGIPTICFYDPTVYIHRKEAQVSIIALQNVGILHHSGKDAARFVAHLGNDIEGWWQKPEVQEARHDFVKCYANFSPDWGQQWEREFEAVLDGAC